MTDMLLELARREKQCRLKPEEDLDIFIKVNAVFEYFCTIVLA